MLDACIIQLSQIPFSALVVMVPKKEGSWSMCPDYRPINNITIKNKFPNPLMNYKTDYKEKNYSPN